MGIYLHTLPPMVWQNGKYFMYLSNMLELHRLQAQTQSQTAKSMAGDAKRNNINSLMQRRSKI